MALGWSLGLNTLPKVGFLPLVLSHLRGGDYREEAGSENFSGSLRGQFQRGGGT